MKVFNSVIAMNRYLQILFFACVVNSLHAWGGNNKKVKLSDVKTLTLHYGQMTTGRRSNPVPQLQCVGGTAGCGAFVPQIVQCYNRGSDGFDIQWECKTDMDNAYRFGRVDVVCEGYDYPDDPYILKGSCGLEYTIDLTEEGIKRKGQGHNYYGNPSHSYGSYQNTQPYKHKSSWFGDGLFLVIVLLVIYGIYRTCLRNYQNSPTGDDYDDYNNRYGSGFGSSGQQPPPPGFRSGYPYGSDSCGSSTMGPSAGGSGSGANNFWSGAMTGGILGYMFGSNNRSRGYQGYREPYSGTSSSWGGFSGSSSGSASSSTGTRSASGYGGTRRR